MQDPLQAVGSAIGQMYQNQENKRSAKRQMEFQAEMSNTAYQRAMKDMELAGLNPILAYKMGGASTPAGAQYQAGNIGKAAVEGYQTATQSSKNRAQTGKAVADTAVSKEQAKKIKEDTKKVKAELIRIKQTTGFEKILHGERWQRLFAIMGVDNIAASLAAAINGVNVQTLLTQVGGNVGANELKDLEEMLETVRAHKSVLGREMDNLVQVLRRAFGERGRRKWERKSPHPTPRELQDFAIGDQNP